MQSERKTISLTMAIPLEHMALLTKSSRSSSRSKNKDAALRLMDHLKRHKGSVRNLSTVTKFSNNTHVTVFLPVDEMQLLTESARLSLTSKSADASMRLIDHLERYQYIANVGNVVPRSESLNLASGDGGLSCQ